MEASFFFERRHQRLTYATRAPRLYISLASAPVAKNSRLFRCRNLFPNTESGFANTARSLSLRCAFKVGRALRIHNTSSAETTVVAKRIKKLEKDPRAGEERRRSPNTRWPACRLTKKTAAALLAGIHCTATWSPVSIRRPARSAEPPSSNHAG